MSEYQETMNRLRAEHDKAIANIKSNEDITDEARARKLREERARYEEARQAEERRELDRLEAESEAQYRRIHKEEEPSGDRAVYEELKLSRIIGELAGEYESRRRSPNLDYKEAVRLGDEVRQKAIASCGAKHPDLGERLALQRRIAENEPEEKKRARVERETLEAQRREVSLGAALHSHAAGERRRRLGG